MQAGFPVPATAVVTATAYRGGASQTLKEEFAAYGLPSYAFYLVGALKITAAAVLDLPHPDSPTRASVSPAPMSKETPSTAVTGAARRVRPG